MIPLGSMTTAGLLFVAGTGAWFDLRERRVPNVLTVGGLILGLLLGALEGWSGLGAATAGAGIALLVGMPFFLAGGLGGGDVKLLVAVGALLGPSELPAALVAITLIGGAMAAVAVIRQGAIRQTLLNLSRILGGLSRETFSRWKGRAVGAPLTVDAADAVTVPYAVAIGLGAVLVRLVL